MAKGIYDKKRPTPKKVSKFDTKIILIIVIAVAVITAAIVAAVLIDADSKSYVGLVDGKRVPVLEYRIFLDDAVSEMETKASEADENYSASSYWTAEKQAEAQEHALKEVAEFNGKYRLAVKNGCELTKQEKTNIKNNLNYYINIYYQMYGSSYSVDQICQLVTGVNITYDELDDYCKYANKLAAIEKYRDKLEETYKVEDLYYKDEDGNVKSNGEQAVLDEYNAHIDDYRRINLTSLVIAKPGSKPTEPTKVTEPTEPENKDETSEEYAEYKTKKDAYDKYVKDLEEYNKKLEEWNKKCDETETKVKAIFDALLKDGKYTGKGIAEVATGEKDDDGNDIKAVPDYTDATLEDIAAKEGVLYASAKGANTFNGTPSSTDFLGTFAHSLEWTDDTRKAVKSTLTEKSEEAAEEGDKEEGETGEESGEETGEEENGNTPVVEPNPDLNDYTLESITDDSGNFKETKLKLFEDDTRYYITKCTGILDINTSTEDEPAEDEDSSATLCVRSVVLNTLKALKSDDDTSKEVADGGAKYQLAKKNNKAIKIIDDAKFASVTPVTA
ncbi:MAG: hypothetical protein J5912_07940 [Clostridia bacterium]|nr:hypothetical protein [Clostridia bacterium]